MRPKFPQKSKFVTATKCRVSGIVSETRKGLLVSAPVRTANGGEDVAQFWLPKNMVEVTQIRGGNGFYVVAPESFLAGKEEEFANTEQGKAGAKLTWREIDPITGSINVLCIAGLLFFLLAPSSHAQYAVSDGAAQSLLAKQNTDFLDKIAIQFQKLDQQIEKLNTTADKATTLVQVAGNPSSALSMVSGMGGLDTSALTNNSAFKLASSIGKAADSSRSLFENGSGVYKSIPSSLPDGTSILRDLEGYKKYDAYEQESKQFEQSLKDGRDRRTQLLDQLKTLMNKPATTEAEQREKIARTQALTAQLAANDAAIRDANDQRQARDESNTQDEQKQKKAELESEIQDLKRGLKRTAEMVNKNRSASQ